VYECALEAYLQQWISSLLLSTLYRDKSKEKTNSIHTYLYLFCYQSNTSLKFQFNKHLQFFLRSVLHLLCSNTIYYLHLGKCKVARAMFVMVLAHLINQNWAFMSYKSVVVILENVRYKSSLKNNFFLWRDFAFFLDKWVVTFFNLIIVALG